MHNILSVSSNCNLLVTSTFLIKPPRIRCPPPGCPRHAARPSSPVPVVENPVDHHPLGFDPIAIEAFLHLCKLGVLVLPLSALLFITTEVPGGRLIHVILPLIVPEHHLTVQLQLQERREKEVPKELCPLLPTRLLSLTTLFIAAPHLLYPRFTCSSDTQEQCQYDMPCHFTKNCRSGRPSKGLGDGVLGSASGGRGTGVGDGG